MRDECKKWKDETLSELEPDCKRLLVRINQAKKETGQYQSYAWASVKRSSLDVNQTGARLRAGFHNSLKF